MRAEKCFVRAHRQSRAVVLSDVALPTAGFRRRIQTLDDGAAGLRLDISVFRNGIAAGGHTLRADELEPLREALRLIAAGERIARREGCGGIVTAGTKLCIAVLPPPAGLELPGIEFSRIRDGQLHGKPVVIFALEEIGALREGFRLLTGRNP